MNIKIRDIKKEDMKLLFQWVNEPLVITNSIQNNKKIDWLVHKKWFSERYKSLNTKIFIFETYESIPFGLVRFDKIDKDAKISFLITKLFRGKSYSKKILKLAIEKYTEEKEYFLAEVKENNIPSVKTFKSLNFKFNLINGIYYFKRH